MKYLILILLLPLSLSNFLLAQNLKDDEILNANFNKNEIKDLHLILNTFDRQMTGSKAFNKIHKGEYKKKVKSVLDSAANTGSCCEFVISQNSIKYIFESISDRTFKKLFKVTKVLDNGKSRITFLPRSIEENSALRSLINSMNNPAKDWYLGNIQAAGDINLSLTHRFYPEIDLSDEKQRLIMAIDFIAYTVQNSFEPDAIANIAKQKSNLEVITR